MPLFEIETEEKVLGTYRVEAPDAQAARDLLDQGSIKPPVQFESVDTEVLAVKEIEPDLPESPKFHNHTLVLVKGDASPWEVMDASRHEVDGWQYVLVRQGKPLSTHAHPGNPILEDQLTEVST